MDWVLALLKATEPWIIGLVPSPADLPSMLEKLFRYCLYVYVLVIASKVVRRLPMIREVVHGFNDARSPIWDFRSTIENFRSTTDDLKKLEPIIVTLREQMALLDEKVDAAQKQLVELQRHSASERTDDIEPPPPGASGNGRPAEASDDASNDQQNWQKLREIWRAHINRLEALIDSIADGRKARPYRNMARYDYRPIIARLQADGLLSDGAARASTQLLDIFKAYRPRNRKVTDKLIGELVFLDKQLAEAVRVTGESDPDAIDISDKHVSEPSPAVLLTRTKPVEPASRVQ